MVELVVPSSWVLHLIRAPFTLELLEFRMLGFLLWCGGLMIWLVFAEVLVQSLTRELLYAAGHLGKKILYVHLIFFSSGKESCYLKTNIL